MYIILAHCHTKSGPHIEVPRRDNLGDPLYATRAAAQGQCDRWNRRMKINHLIQNRYYHVYSIKSERD